MRKTTTSRKGKDPCPYCGKWCAPGPMKQHLKACDKNPLAGEFHIEQPKGECPYCGLVTTAGALATHMNYGCEKRPADGGDARKTCQYCGKVTTLPPALISHERICPSNPATPQRIKLSL